MKTASDSDIQLKVKTLPYFEAIKTLDLPEHYNNLFSSPEWLRIIHQTYHSKLFVKYIEENKRIASCITYSVVHNFLEWKICIGSYCDYFDCSVADAKHWHMFFEDLRREYPKYRIAIRNLKDLTARECPDFNLLSKELHHEIDIRDQLDVLWREAHRSFKAACARARNKGLVIKRCPKSALDQFYRLHLRLRKNKYGLFPQPYRFFENIWQQFMQKDRGILLGAYDTKNNFVAGNIYLICGDTLFYKFSTSSLDALKLKPNNLLMWEGIKFAKERGLSCFDLGSSGLEQDGLVWFKTHICKKTTQRDIHHLGFAPTNYKYSQKRILNTYTKFFTHQWMPDGMVKFGSNFIYPFLA